MQHQFKSSNKYLSQFKNGQNEKTNVWIEEISRQLKEQNPKKINFKLLEIGPGAGYTIEYIKKYFA